ncbi:unnamed protein product [Peniophora sp. CBMAI 1063]|nr:unnamed protein product [Peniophora sp. CBMAI 1063]
MTSQARAPFESVLTPQKLHHEGVASPQPTDPCSEKIAAATAFAVYEESRDPAHLDTAIALLQIAIELQLDPDVDLLTKLESRLWSRFQDQGKLADLESAIKVQERVVELTADDHSDKAAMLDTLSDWLLRRFQRLLSPADLQRAIKAKEHSIELTPDDPLHKPTMLDALGDLHVLRYHHLGDLSDLERAIAAQQRALELSQGRHPDELEIMANLAAALGHRFERLGEPDDIQSAIEMGQRVIELTSNDDPDIPSRLDTLGLLYGLRYDHSDDLDSEDVEHAVTSHRRAVALTPEGHSEKPNLLLHLGMALLDRFDAHEDVVDLDDALRAQERAIEILSATNSVAPSNLSTLGVSLNLHYDYSGDVHVLDLAITAHRRATRLMRDGDPSNVTYLYNLGCCLASQLHVDPSEGVFNEAISCFTAAASQRFGNSTERIRASRRAVLLHHDHPEYSTPETKLLAFSLHFDIIPELVWLGHGVKRRFEESENLGELVNQSVGEAIRTGNLPRAIEWLEAGRYLVWSQVLSLRSPLDEVERLRPDLSHTLRDIQAQLQQSVQMSFSRKLSFSLGKPDPAVLDHNKAADVHRNLAIEYDHVLAEIRRQPGLEDFMRPKRFSAISSSLTLLSGPVVFINAYGKRCDAVVMFPNRSPISVALSELTLVEAEKLRSVWSAYLRQRNVRERATSFVSDDDDVDGLDGPVVRMLEYTWTWVVSPILGSLGFLHRIEGARLPQITWCPMGPLTQIPLHAAGIYSNKAGPRAYDYVISSYTPSLSALMRSLEATLTQVSTPSVLVITQPNTPGLRPLPGTKLEGARLQAILSDYEIASSVLEGRHATHDAVRAVIKKHPWIHLACHGFQNRSNPTQSAFALHDRFLSLEDLMVTASDNAELAFLSACQTAAGDETISEESMHLAAGTLAVGFKGVIATMWSIRDNDAPLVVESYYRTLLELRKSGNPSGGGTGAAYALHEAAKHLREKVGANELARWAPFVHFGA